MANGNSIKINQGDRYGRLTVIKEVESFYRKDSKVRRRFLFKCDCGTFKEIVLNDVRNGRTKSCGCLNKELTLNRLNERERFHTHSESKSIEYRLWLGMKQRCYNHNHPRYKDWGGRGIIICDRWLGRDGFKNFLEDMGRRPGKEYSIDRKDNEGNYEPLNCKWSTPKEQMNNRRCSKKKGE